MPFEFTILDALQTLRGPVLVLAAFIGFTRLYLYVHFPTDILGGIALGLAAGWLGSRMADKFSNKWDKLKAAKQNV